MVNDAGMSNRRALTQAERGTRLAIFGAVLLAWMLIVALTTGGTNGVMLLIGVLGIALIAVGLMWRGR